jgi:hypothetical protein
MRPDFIEYWWLIFLAGWISGVIMGSGGGWMGHVVYLDWYWRHKMQKMEKERDNVNDK